jgi:hypothetical protein
MSTRIAFESFFLASQRAHLMTNLRFICIDLLVNRLMANRQLSSYLLRTPLQTVKRSDFKHNMFINISGITAALRKLMRQILCLAWSISSLTTAKTFFSTNRRFMASQNLGNFRLCLSCFHERINLLTFGLAGVCIGHELLRLASQKALIL